MPGFLNVNSGEVLRCRVATEMIGQNTTQHGAGGAGGAEWAEENKVGSL